MFFPSFHNSEKDSLLLLSFLDGSFKFKRRPFKVPPEVSFGMYREINVKGF
jgi:hypothetical protein